MRIWRFMAILTLTTVVGLAGCENEPTAPANGVNVLDNEFEPGTRTVAAGTTVTWEWLGSNPHNVTWVAGDPAASATQSSGTYTRTFGSAGTFEYYCTIHGTPTSGMRGTIVVQ